MYNRKSFSYVINGYAPNGEIVYRTDSLKEAISCFNALVKDGRNAELVDNTTGELLAMESEGNSYYTNEMHLLIFGYEKNEINFLF